MSNTMSIVAPLLLPTLEKGGGIRAADAGDLSFWL
jgi:hypothetical protein